MMNRLKTFLLACLVAVVLVALSMLALRHPLEEPDKIQAMLEESRQRAEQLRVLNHEENGFRDLESLLTTPASQPHPEREKFAALLEYPTDSVAALRKKIEADPSTFRAAQQQFAEVMPSLRRAASRPYFAWPPATDITSPVPALSSLRAMVTGLAVSGLDLAAAGQQRAALEQLVMAAEFSAKLSPANGLLALAVKMSNTGIALDAIGALLKEIQLEPEQLRWLLSALKRLQLAPDEFGRAMDAEIMVMANTLEKIMAGEQLADAGHHGQALGGTGLFSSSSFLVRPYFRRNLNLMLNFHMQNRAAFYDPSLAFDPTVGEMLQQRWMAHIVHIMVPNFERARDQYLFLLTRIEATRAAAALQLYRHQHGSYPDNLAALVGDYLDAEPRDYMSGEAFSYVISEQGFALSSDSPRYQNINKQSPFTFF